jgi:hypothetical protein
MKAHLLLALILLTGASCTSQKNQTTTASKSNPINSISYRFQDASVPPQYHRSYTLTITPTTLTYTLDSYGDILKDTTVAISEEKWQRAVKAFEGGKFRNAKKESTDDGCTGGTGNSLIVQGEQGEIFRGRQYKCGGDVYGDMQGDVEGLLEEMKSDLPPGVVPPF